MLNTRQQMGFPMAGPRRAEQHAAPRFFKRLVEDVGQNLKRLTIHRFCMRLGKAPEGFKKELKRMFVSHEGMSSKLPQPEAHSAASQALSEENPALPNLLHPRKFSSILNSPCFPEAMKNSIVMTVLGDDRPGLVRSLAETVANHGGNWLESRMARLAGQFAGVVRIECPAETVDALIQDLQIAEAGLTVFAVREESVEAPPPRRTLVVDVVGNDRPGIVRELAAAVAGAGGNIEELTTGLESAPMSGQLMFRAHGIFSIPESAETAAFAAAIECLGGDLTVDVVL